MAPVLFWEQPRRYLLWSARQRPALFWSFIVGCIGPIMVFTVPPIRQRLGDPPRQHIPLTYPIPKGPRQKTEGYED